MGYTKGKCAINARKPDKLPSKRKRRNATEVANSVSHTDGPQPRMTGQNKVNRGGVTTRSHGDQTVEGQVSDRAVHYQKSLYNTGHPHIL